MKHPIGFVSLSLVLERGNLQDVSGNLQLVVFLCYFYQEINYDHGPNSLNGVNHSETRSLPNSIKDNTIMYLAH